jgi:hypothetical protein
VRRYHFFLGTVILVLMILVSACGARSEPVISEGPPLQARIAATSEPTGTEESIEELAITEEPAEPPLPVFDPANFDSSTRIDNKWMPMKPGTFWAYEGSAIDEGENVARRIEFTVTDLTKEIDGVQMVVTWTEDFNNGELIEKEISFYAQDKDGNVWYFGEYPEEYAGGEFVEAPTWIAGIAGAQPGIKMQPDPQLGAPSLYQGWGPEVEWSDYGQVDQMGVETCVPVACYENVLVMAESSLGEEGAYQLKYYAADVGNVQVGWKGTDEAHEELKLVEYRQLTPEELAVFHAQALELEKHAYEISTDIYGQTSPLE